MFQPGDKCAAMDYYLTGVRSGVNWQECYKPTANCQCPDAPPDGARRSWAVMVIKHFDNGESKPGPDVAVKSGTTHLARSRCYQPTQSGTHRNNDAIVAKKKNATMKVHGSERSLMNKKKRGAEIGRAHV